MSSTFGSIVTVYREYHVKVSHLTFIQSMIRIKRSIPTTQYKTPNWSPTCRNHTLVPTMDKHKPYDHYFFPRLHADNQTKRGGGK